MAIQSDIAIIGAGPAGIFSAFQMGQLGLSCHIIDILEQPGGQCQELYPEKPIFDIPGVPQCTGSSLIQSLLCQTERFQPVFHLGEQAITLDRATINQWRLTTDKGTILEVKAIIIAGGIGSFTPRRLSVKGSDSHEDRHLLYAVKTPEAFKDKELAICGGGDSALDWAIALEPIAKHISVIHRRDVFKASPGSVNSLRTLAAEKKLDLTIAVPTALHGKPGKLTHITVTNSNGIDSDISCDYVLAFFGLTNKLGPLAQWGLELKEDKISVDPRTMATNLPGIYAIGDIAQYSGKLNLILTGFHEAAMSSRAAYQYINGYKPRFQHSTHNDALHAHASHTAQTSANPTLSKTDNTASFADIAPIEPIIPNGAAHILVRTLDGLKHSLPAKTGQTLLEIIGEGKLPIKGSCYGCCNCSTCHVYIDDAWISELPQTQEQELDALDMVTQPRTGSRLACQIEFEAKLDGLSLALAIDTIPD